MSHHNQHKAHHHHQGDPQELHAHKQHHHRKGEGEEEGDERRQNHHKHQDEGEKQKNKKHPHRDAKHKERHSHEREGSDKTQPRKTIQDEDYKDLTHRQLLNKLAFEAMEAKDILTEFSDEVVAALEPLKKEYETHQTEEDWKSAGYKDQRQLLWVSIDNDDSRDLDQLSTAFYDQQNRLHVLVSIAEVDHLVHYQSAIDRHAEHNSTSVYTPAKVFTMLPEILCFDYTSLNPGVDRRSIVVDMTFENEDSGIIIEEDIYLSVVHNHAKLAYPSVGAWIEQDSEDETKVPPPAPIADRKDLQENILLQDRVARALLARRLEAGALEFDKREGFVKWDGDTIKEIVLEKRNRATQLIENLMIAANGASSRFLGKHGLSTLQRVVRDPERWELLQNLARKFGGHLPNQPQSKALQLFLNARRKADPLTFPDLSLQVIKLMGRGEYCYHSINEPEHEGHFGLAVLDYTHTTAPNRRFPDLITQRLLKSILLKTESPYSEDNMQDLAGHCTLLEGETTKIERQIRKSACAILLQDKVGQEFEGIITGASSKGTYVRIFDPPTEGKVVKKSRGCTVGNKVKVRLAQVDIIRGYIDFERLKEEKHQPED